MEPNIKTNWSLPEYMIAGTLFGYHAELNEFIERDMPSNRIAMEGIWSESDLWTQFFYHDRIKNLYQGGFPEGERPKNVQLILIPTLPLCAKRGIHVKTFHEKEAESKKEQQQKLQGPERNKRKIKKSRRIS